MKGWRGLGLLIALAGCARVWIDYTPAKAEYAGGMPQTVPLATVAYEGDIPALVAAGGEALGRIEGAGNGFAGQRDVEERVRRDAASRGATHVIFVKAYAEQDQTPDQYQTTCAKNGVCTTTNVGGVSFSRPHAGYVLIRVPEANLAALPVALRVSTATEAPTPPAPEGQYTNRP